MKKPLLVLSASLLLLTALLGAGCSNNPSQSSSQYIPTSSSVEPSGGVAIAYTANETAVYTSTVEVVNAVADTVVEISTESVTTVWGRQYIVSGAGSGVIVAKEDNTYYIITNHHVIEGANDVTVTTREGVEYKATIVASDDSEDIGIVKIVSEKELKLATWGNSDTLQIGEDLIAIGNPLGNLGGTVTKGILSAKGRTIAIENYAMTLLQTDTAINPGNSGGGLFNMRGQLIGIVNAKNTQDTVEGICFAIPVNKAQSVFENLLKNGYLLGRACFDVTLGTGTLNNEEVVYLTEVGNVEENTFKQYDRIYSINGELISSVLSYNVALSHIKAGDRVEVKVYRGTYRGGMWGGISFDDELTTFNATALQYGK